MSMIEEQRNEAERVYLTAQEHLDACRTRYTEGSGRELAECYAQISALEAKLAKCRSDEAAANAQFAQAFAAAGYEQTKAVRQHLNTKNDAAAMAELIEQALAACKMKAEALRFDSAGPEARQYGQAYVAAARAHAKATAFRALAAHGEAIALALCDAAWMDASEDPDQRHMASAYEHLTGDEYSQHKELVFRALDSMAKALLASGRHTGRPPEAIGELDYGPLTGKGIPTPAESAKRRMTQQLRSKVDATSPVVPA